MLRKGCPHRRLARANPGPQYRADVDAKDQRQLRPLLSNDNLVAPPLMTTSITTIWK